jgi:viroplasmin and RNaseH domain-containing protein
MDEECGRIEQLITERLEIWDDATAMSERVGKKGKNRKRKWYAVAKGRTTGVFAQWRDAERSVQGYPGAVHKRFQSEEAARAWLTSKGAPDDSDVESDVTTEATQYDVKYHFFRSYINRKEITVHPIDTSLQKADYLTKPVSFDILQRLRPMVMGW